jgi:hypothetical protein
MGRLGSGSLLSRLAVLLLAFAALWLLMAPVAWAFGGVRGVQASALATLVCLVAGSLALLVVHQFRPAQHALAHLFAGMAIRTGLPLLICLLVVRQGGGLQDAGFAWYLLVAFMWGLLLETAMAVGQLNSLQT